MNYDERKTENNAPSIIVKIKDVTGSIQKYIVSERPEWSDEDLIYITHSDRGMIVYNKRNIISYSEKTFIPKKPYHNKPIVNEVEEDEEN